MESKKYNKLVSKTTKEADSDIENKFVVGYQWGEGRERGNRGRGKKGLL